MLLPIMLSEIPGTGGALDFETPYGYGGPIATTSDPHFWVAGLGSIIGEMKDIGIVCGFIRFHPLLANACMTSDYIEVIRDRLTVSINLEQDESTIWNSQIHPKNRNAIRKAESEGLEFKVDNSFEYFEDFFALYRATMKMHNADEFYLFPRTYYATLRKSIPDHCFLGVVKKTGRVISSAIFLYDEVWGHYHLAGSNEEARALCANNMLVYRAALELKHRGVRKMHLGGGTDSSDGNSLLGFKKKFSPNSQWFYIGKLMVDQARYDEISSVWVSNFPDKIAKYGKMLLKYRM